MLKLQATTVVDILWWAEANPTVEVTGMVVHSPRGQRVVPMQNVARRPEVYYEWDPLEMAQQWEAMADDENLLAIYHSHPNGRKDPSPRDMEGALMEGVWHLIAYPRTAATYGGTMDDPGNVWRLSVYECIEPGILVRDELRMGQMA